MKGIPKRPELLVACLANLLAGDTKNQQDGVLPNDVRADLTSMKAMLESMNTKVTTSKGQYRQDAQARREYIEAVLQRAEQARAAVIAKYGETSEKLADFALATRRKRSKARSTESKAERAQNLLAKARVKLETAKTRMSTLEALVARREIEASLAAPVTPPEPGPSNGPEPVQGK